MLELQWMKCRQRIRTPEGLRHAYVWWDLDKADFGFLVWQGVYVIWQDTDPVTLLRVGMGDVAAAVRRDRQTLEIPRKPRPLLSWARVAPKHQEGVVRFLQENWTPALPYVLRGGDAPIAVRAPWQLEVPVAGAGYGRRPDGPTAGLPVSA